VKLLFDENISPRLVGTLSDIYPDSAHVHECALGSADDSVVWEYARVHGLTIVSKDSDFQERSVILGAPPKVIWIRVWNSNSAEIENLLRAALPIVKRFIEDDEESCLILGLRIATD